MTPLHVNTIGTSGSSPATPDAAPTPEPRPRLLVLVHGYGADEHDLAPIARRIDPEGHFFAIAPRAPIDLFPFGAGWYERDADRNIDPVAFVDAVNRLDATIDHACERHGLERDRAVVIGFSQGGAMTLAAGLRADRTDRPAAIACLSGMLHDIDGLPLDFGSAPTHVLVHHGALDQVVDVARGRAITERFSDHDVAHTYREYAMGHEISAESIGDLRAWLAGV